MLIYFGSSIRTGYVCSWSILAVSSNSIEQDIPGGLILGSEEKWLAVVKQSLLQNRTSLPRRTYYLIFTYFLLSEIKAQFFSHV